MAFYLVQPQTGRGSFATGTKIGGTLDTTGLLPGSYYRAPADKSVKMPGLIGALAVRNGTECSMNTYAVHRAVYHLQETGEFGTLVIDGILGPNSDTGIRAYQRRKGLKVDGVIGPKTCKALFEPLVRKAAQAKPLLHRDLIYRNAMGTMYVESGFDLGTVGETTPDDIGIAQINGRAHPDMSVNQRFDPKIAISYMVDLIEKNLIAMKFDEDLSIIAYNLGPTGAYAWNSEGRPEWFRGTNTWKYISDVKTVI